METARETGFKKPQKQEKEHKAQGRDLLARLGVSAGAGLALFALLLPGAAAACLALDLPRERLAWVGIPLAALAAFAAGYLLVRPLRRQALLSGLLTGAALYAGILPAAVLISRAPLGGNAVLLLLAALLGGAAGGVFAANSTAAGRGGTERRGPRRKRPRRR